MFLSLGYGRGNFGSGQRLTLQKPLTPPLVVIMIGITPPQVDALPKMSGSR